MKTRTLTLSIMTLVVALTVSDSSAGMTTNTYYVNVQNVGNSVAPYTSWITAATNIQHAVDQADAAYVKDETIGLVRVAAGHYLLTETLSITNNPLILLNDAGRDETLIDGQGAVVGITIKASGAIVDGFTVRNGKGGITGGNVSLIAGTLQNARITDGSASYGGGVYMAAGTISNCVVDGNSGVQGGGIYLNAGVVMDCIITNNTCGNSNNARGAGIRMQNGTVDRCLVASNRGSQGGGIYSVSGTIRNCLIIDNQADVRTLDGGGVYLTSATLQNCTVVGNSAIETGGGIYLGSKATMRNCIAYFNSALTADNLYRVDGSSVENSCFSPEIPDDAKTRNNTVIDPHFVNWGAGDYHLLPGSPAIDTGSATGATAYDYSGNPRPVDGSGDGTAKFDMGALEAASASAGDLRCNTIGSPRVGFRSLFVSFVAHVAGDDTNGMHYAWDFGDGATLAFSPTRNATHLYEDYGIFDVTLTVSNAAEQVATIVQPAYIEVGTATNYVSPNGSHSWPFASWETAATSLQAAVDAALDTPDIKSRVLVGDGNYLLHETLTIEKNITVESQNGAEVTILDGGGSANTVRAVYIRAEGGALFRGFTVSNSVAAESGAGIYLGEGAVRNCIVVNNQTTGSSGGGIYMAAGTVVSNCLVRGNMVPSTSAGGGVLITGNSIIEDCEIRDNEVRGSSYGAGIHATGAATIRNCWIHHNASFYRGGGVYIAGGALEDCLIENNRASITGTGGGGGVYENGNSTIERNRFFSNIAALGGAAGLRTDCIFRNNLVVGNESSISGGGIYTPASVSGQLIENNTVVGNYAVASGGGIYQVSGAIKNTIIWGNEAGSGGNDFSGTITNISTSCASDIEPSVENGNINTDPMFVRPGSGVGLSHVFGANSDYHLKVDSPCAKTGTVLSWMEGAVDLDGSPRNIQAGVVSMGAYEKLIPPSGTLFLIK